MGDELVIGLNSDEEVMAIKGPTVLNIHERAEIMKSCKWIDEVVENSPYDVTVETLDKHRCNYYAHGDDLPINAEGIDALSDVRS